MPTAKKESFPSHVWNTLKAIDCGDHIEKKGRLSYLSWAWAWATLMDEFPDSEFTVGNLVNYDDGTVEVWMTVTVKENDFALSRQMWLPVMDHKNNSVIHPTSRQISDTRMRCLVKALAMCGLGHYIYAGEDVPTEDKPEPPLAITAAQASDMRAELQRIGMDEPTLCERVRIEAIDSLEASRFDKAMKYLYGLPEQEVEA